ncbi:MAG: hypothetical protein ABIG45_01305 [Bacillota bacterium]
MYVWLGWLNVAFLAVMTAPYWLRFLNQRTLRLKGGAYGKTIKVLRALHKPLGVAVVLIAAVHGYLALGAFRLHTGTILGTSVLLTALFGLSFYLAKKKFLFTWHKRLALLSILLLLVHLLFPGAVYYLLRI